MEEADLLRPTCLSPRGVIARSVPNVCIAIRLNECIVRRLSRDLSDTCLLMGGEA